MIIDSGILPEDFSAKSQDEDESELLAERRRRWWYRLMLKYGAVGKRMVQVVIDLGRMSFGRELVRNNGAKSPLWPAIVLGLFCYFTLKLPIAIYHQYAFDYHHYFLVKFEERASRCSLNANATRLRDIEAARRRLVGNYQSAGDASKVIGAPFMHANYVLPPFLILILLNCSLIYFVPQFYNHLDISELQLILLTPEEAQQLSDALIRAAVNSLIMSSRNHCRKSIEVKPEDEEYKHFCSRDNQYDYYKQRNSARRAPAERQVRRYRTLRDHRSLVERAKGLASEGKLLPYNRRASWRELSNLYFAAYSVFVPSCVCIYLTWVVVVPIWLGVKLETDAMDWLFRVEIFVYNAFVLCVGIVLYVLLLAVCMDQARTTSILCDLIDGCIQNNTRILLTYFRISRQGTTSLVSLFDHQNVSMAANTDRRTNEVSVRCPASIDSVSDAINSSLMHILLHYHMFVKQLRPQFEFIALWTTLSVLLIASPPVAFRLFTYHASKRYQTVMVASMTLYTVLIDMGLATICRQHERCLHLHRRLQSLMAHVIDMGQVVKARADRGGYNEHLVQALRRELSHPERLTDRFSAETMWLRFNITYDNVLKFNFWFGLWAVSSMTVDFSQPDARDIFGGVWRFYGGVDAELDHFFSDCSQ